MRFACVVLDLGVSKVQLERWFRSWVPDSLFSAGGGRSSVADVVKSFDAVDRGILDRVLSSLGLPGWFRHAYFEYHGQVRLRFKLAAGQGMVASVKGTP